MCLRTESKTGIISFYVLVFLGLHPWHMEALRLRVELELQLLAYTTATATLDLSCIFDLCCSLGPREMLNPLSMAWGQTHILRDSIRFLIH